MFRLVDLFEHLIDGLSKLFKILFGGVDIPMHGYVEVGDEVSDVNQERIS